MPWVAVGGDSLQWSVAVNILNKQSQTANRGWSSSLGVGWGTDRQFLSVKLILLWYVTQGLGLKHILWN